VSVTVDRTGTPGAVAPGPKGEPILGNARRFQRDIMQALQAGRVIVHRLTVPEGLTTSQILALVGQADVLAGELACPCRRRSHL